MKLYYRISDQSYPKPKLPGSDKEVCLLNFVGAFRTVIFGDSSAGQPLRVVCDRCNPDTVDMVRACGLPLSVTDRGNAGSFREALAMAITQPDDEVAYFCEDDYLHHPAAPKALAEGCGRADYVTLYDHPDKYTRYYNGGEYSKVIRTDSSHWRFTVSTCMTFAAKAKTLREDWEVFLKYTDGPHPHDHAIFTELQKKGRRLAVSIPGLACHTDLTFAGHVNKVMMEPWAVDLMVERIDRELGPEWADLRNKVFDEKKGWERLVGLDALLAHKNKAAGINNLSQQDR